MIKRGPIIVIGIIVVVLLAAPYAIGMMNENTLHSEVERISASGVYRTTVTSFERGWFGSTASIDVGISPDYINTIQGGEPDPIVEAMFGDLALPVIVEFGHGPVLLDDGLALGTVSVHAYVSPESEIAMLAQQFLGMPYVLDIRGHGGFGSGFHYEGEVPPIEFASPDMSVDSTGVSFSGTWSALVNRFEGELGSVMVQSPFLSAIVEGVSFFGDTERSAPNTMALGTTGGSIGRISISDPLQGTNAAFSFEGFGASATMAESSVEGFLDFQTLYRIGAVSIPGLVELSDFALGLNLSHLDIEAANELYRFGSSMGQLTDPEAMLAALTPVLERMLQNDPVLSIEPLQASMPEGSLDGSVTVRVDSAGLPQGSILNLQTPAAAAAAINAVSADIELTASKALANRIAAMALAAQANQAGPLPGPDGEPLSPAEITELMEAQASVLFLGLAAQGILVDEGDSYSTSMRLADGVLTANGQPLPMGL